MDNHPIENLMKSTMENIKDMIDVNTIVGDPVCCEDGTTILPISKVSFGFASGGAEFNKENKINQSQNSNSKFPFGGGSGAGITLKPVAFLVSKNDSIRLLSVDHQNPYDGLVDAVPQVLEMFQDLINNKCNKNSSKCCEDENSNENK